MTTTAIKAEKVVVAKSDKLTGTAAAQAGVDQAAADLRNREAEAAEAAQDAEDLAVQVTNYEDRIRRGDADVDPGQLIELGGLHRFSVLRLEAAQSAVSDANRKRLAADIRLAAARQREYAATAEQAFIDTFWQAVKALSDLRTQSDAQERTGAEFTRRRQALVNELASVAPVDESLNDALNDLDQAPTPMTSFFRGTFPGLALSEAWPPGDGYAQAAASPGPGISLSDFPQLLAGKPGDLDV